uniref:Coiled-coil domain containing 81 n=1 Tax=Astyanax mexicanus TaxID=7994 RepID=A0A8B9JZS1_ASTMX
NLYLIDKEGKMVIVKCVHCSSTDVDHIWANVASFIERQMALQKAVCISGLGTFTFSQLKLDVGSKYVLIQRPIFQLSERLCQTHGLKHTKALAAGDIPVVPLNFTALSVESPFDRDVVEGCIHDTLLLLYRSISPHRSCFFTFRGIGILFFHHGNVKMKFYKDFITSMDGTGKLLWAMTNRPGTSSSVVSGKLSHLQQPMTSNAILLPKISPGESPRDIINISYPLHYIVLMVIPCMCVTVQELCYLCMQRTQRNIPLYLTEEKMKAEKEEEKVLLLAKQHKDEQFLKMEQIQQEEDREYNKKTAAFNLEIAEALKAKKSARPSQFDGSYIFHGRPVTPPMLLKQRRYMQELLEQAAYRRQQNTQSKQNHELIDRLHQIQLADEIAKQRSQEIHQKKENIKSYQKALSAQRATGIPARQPDSDGPVFGVRDRAPSALAEQKQRARKLYQEQLSTANTKRKEALFNRLEVQRKERDMLHRSRKELIADRISRYEKLRNVQASLEDTWTRSADLKHHRDQEERDFIRSGSRLLIDQCQQYRRCHQCKRKTSNCGESNIWKESRYIPGSRLMV